jgi:hypothetical protein
MSSSQNVFETEKAFSSRFKVSFEIILIYVTAGLIILTFFDSIKVALYASLGYIALFMFLSVFVLMVGYTLYNFGKTIYILLSK